MHLLRTSFWLSRLILAWFALTLGAASASPLIHPQAMELICTTSGEMLWVQVGASASSSADSLTGEDTQDTAHDIANTGQHNTLDCALCLPFAPPAPLHLSALPPTVQPLSYALRPWVAAHIASVTRAPLPARGPPTHS